MQRISYILVILFLIVSCSKSKTAAKIVKEPVMYEASEMALLMRSMFEYNKATKNQIINKDSLLPFPEEFLTIHSAILTDPYDRDTKFDSISKEFLSAQKAMVQSSQDSVKYHFNTSINSCVSCHEIKCSGPLPKIRKLLIK